MVTLQLLLIILVFFNITHFFIGEKENAYRVLVGKPEGKRPPGRPTSSWENNIKIYRREIGWCGMGCTHLAQARNQWWALVDTAMNIRVP
jgi:hypothetical protein